MYDTDIRLSVPFVNDTYFINALTELADSAKGSRTTIFEVYGALPNDPVGNLRPPATVRPMDKAQLAERIAEFHRHGIKFNYVMNSELLPIPLTEEYIDTLIGFIQELCDAGIDEITVTIPYVIGLIKRHFPKLKVNASICNEIASVREAVEFEELGADVIVLDRDANRDFPLLRDIRRSIKGGIKVLCNSACVFNCINVHYHGTYSSALSNSMLGISEEGKTSFKAPYCAFYCRRRFFDDPAELIKMHWIRPEDMPLYADEGINLFKIDGRDKTPDYLLAVVKAYLNGSFSGNFFHLLQPEFCEDIFEIQNAPDGLYSDGEDTDTLDKQTDAFLAESEKWLVGIRNSDLDGFAEAFASEKIVCRGNCGKCGYCEKIAKKIEISPEWQQRMIRTMDHNLDRYFKAGNKE